MRSRWLALVVVFVCGVCADRLVTSAAPSARSAPLTSVDFSGEITVRTDHGATRYYRPRSVLVDGRTVLAGIGSTVFMVTRSGEVPVLPGLLKITAITVPVHGTAYVADSGRNQIYRLRGLGGNLETDILAGPKQGIGAPVALAVSQDGGRAFVVNSKSRTVSIIDLHGHTPVTKIACGCAPTGLDRLVGNEVFRLTEPSNRPLWMLDASARVPRVLFIPEDLAGSSQK